jgi:hypothetical protein
VTHQSSNRRTGRLVIWAVGLVMGAVVTGGAPGLKASAAEGVLSRIPDSAPGFLLFKDPRGFSDTVAQLNQDLGVNHPMLADVMMMLKLQAGIAGGVNENGDFAMVMTRLALPPEKPELVLLAPVSDYAAFTQNFGVEAGEGVQALQMAGKPAFVKQSGDYAVIGDSQTAVEAFPNKEYAKWDGYGGAYGSSVMGDSTVLIGLDLVHVGPVLQPLMAVQLMQAKQQLQQTTATLPEAQRQNMKTAMMVLDGYAKVINATLRDGQAFVLGLGLDEAGLGLNAAVQFKEDSEMAGALEGGETEPGFNRLPNRPFMFATSMNVRSLPYESWLNELIVLAGEDTAWGEYMGSMVDAFKSLPAQQQGIYPPTPGGQAPSLMSVVTVYEASQPAESLANIKSMVESLDGFDLGTGMKYNTSYSAGAKEVEGYTVDTYRMDMEMTPEMMAQMGMMSMFMQSFTHFQVTTTDDTLVAASASDDTLFAETLGLEPDQSLDQSEWIQATQRRLYPNRVLEGYVGVDTLLGVGVQMMAFFMPEAKVEVPQNLPPIGFGVSVQNGGVGKRLFIPMPLIKSLTKTAMDMQKMFQPPQPAPGLGAPGQSL